MRVHEQLGIAVDDDRVHRRSQAVPLARRPPLHEAVVEERDAAVVVELVVARMRIAVEDAVPEDRVLGEAPDDLAGALLGGGGLVPAELVEAHPLDPLRGQQVLRAELGHELGDADPRMAPEAFLELG